MKAQLVAAILGVAALSASPVAAQGVVRGAQQGAATGNNIAGPVGGAVGGAVGAVGGGIAGGVKGVLGIPQSTSYKSTRATTSKVYSTRTAQPRTTMSPSDPHGGNAHTPSPAR
ncbi:hypothetical protein ABLE91_03510 [Aquabacter sp. CN5-332]|uniref:hypothetical protein n=1 Tax=Aquabacter sp. CN5-332 TaxID=3156608 RepID=UPI0032B4BBCC